jgi:hypothetical protein
MTDWAVVDGGHDQTRGQGGGEEHQAQGDVRGTPSRTTTNGNATPMSSPKATIHHRRSTNNLPVGRGSRDAYDDTGT